MIVSIHQPNFFPHYPFFEKMGDSHIFIILKNCQFEKNNYQNRFNVDGKWYTMRVPHGLKPIAEKEYISPYEDFNIIKSKLPDYNLNIFDECIEGNLAQTNINIIRKITKILDIQTEIVEDYPTELRGSERLVDLCKYYGATKYISGVSGIKYLDLKPFADENINVVFQKSESIPIIKILHDRI